MPDNADNLPTKESKDHIAPFLKAGFLMTACFFWLFWLTDTLKFTSSSYYTTSLPELMLSTVPFQVIFVGAVLLFGALGLLASLETQKDASKSDVQEDKGMKKGTVRPYSFIVSGFCACSALYVVLGLYPVIANAETILFHTASPAKNALYFIDIPHTIMGLMFILPYTVKAYMHRKLSSKNEAEEEQEIDDLLRSASSEALSSNKVNKNR